MVSHNSKSAEKKHCHFCFVSIAQKNSIANEKSLATLLIRWIPILRKGRPTIYPCTFVSRPIFPCHMILPYQEPHDVIVLVMERYALIPKTSFWSVQLISEWPELWFWPTSQWVLTYLVSFIVLRRKFARASDKEHIYKNDNYEVISSTCHLTTSWYHHSATSSIFIIWFSLE